MGRSRGRCWSSWKSKFYGSFATHWLISTQVSVALPGNSAKSELLTRFSHSDEKLTVLEQRQPKLVDGQYSLNFYGRATVASVKNFQLVPGLSDDTVVFQLGKIGDHDFNLDFAPPFTPFSAFALAVSQF